MTVDVELTPEMALLDEASFEKAIKDLPVMEKVELRLKRVEFRKANMTPEQREEAVQKERAEAEADRGISNVAYQPGFRSTGFGGRHDRVTSKPKKPFIDFKSAAANDKNED